MNSPHLTKIVNPGLQVTYELTKKTRERLIKMLRDKGRRLSLPQVMYEARKILKQFEPLLAQSIGETELASWVRGVQVMTNRTPAAILKLFDRGLFSPNDPRMLMPSMGTSELSEPIIRDLGTEQGVLSLLEKNVLTKSEFNRSADAIKQRAFTVAGNNSVKTLEKVQETVADLAARGTSIGEFQDAMDALPEAEFLSDAHLENVYRTNTQMAFAAGQERIARHPVVRNVFPYARYVSIHDERARDDHLMIEAFGLDGTNIFRSDDPMWQMFTPPWDFNCRCGKVFMTTMQAAKKGVREAMAWRETGEPPTYPEWRAEEVRSEVQWPPESGYIGQMI